MVERYGAVRLTAVAAACALLAAGAAAKTSGHARKAHAPAAAGVIKDCSDCPDMVTAPAGQFMMGSPNTEKHRGTEAQHPVVVPAFAVSRYEVTFAQWEACVADGGCNGYRPDAPWGRGRHPRRRPPTGRR